MAKRPLLLEPAEVLAFLLWNDSFGPPPWKHGPSVCRPWDQISRPLKNRKQKSNLKIQIRWFFSLELNCYVLSNQIINNLKHNYLCFLETIGSARFKGVHVDFSNLSHLLPSWIIVFCKVWHFGIASFNWRELEWMSLFDGLMLVHADLPSFEQNNKKPVHSWMQLNLIHNCDRNTRALRITWVVLLHVES